MPEKEQAERTNSKLDIEGIYLNCNPAMQTFIKSKTDEIDEFKDRIANLEKMSDEQLE